MEPDAFGKFIRSRKVAINEVVPGMQVAEDIKSPSGGIVMSADSILLRNNIERLKESGIGFIFVIQKEKEQEFKPLRGKKALIIDDSLFIRHMFAKMFYNMGLFVCADSESAEEGIRMAHLHKPDIIVMDIHLPGMNGIEAIRKLKGKLSGTKFLAVSSDKEKDIVVTAIKAGAGDFLLKPIKWNQIETRISNLFRD